MATQTPRACRFANSLPGGMGIAVPESPTTIRSIVDRRIVAIGIAGAAAGGVFAYPYPQAIPAGLVIQLILITDIFTPGVAAECGKAVKRPTD